MKTATLILIAVAAIAAILPAERAAAQAPQVTPPADPETELPRGELDELIELLDCDCECDCCRKLKQRIKKRLKDPDARPMLAPGSKASKAHRGPRAKVRARARRIHRDHAPSGYKQRRPRTGNRWLDAAHTHKLRKARAARRKALRLMTEEQRDATREMRYRERLELIDLEATSKKQELELKRMMREEVSEKQLRGAIDALMKTHADIKFLKLKARLDERRLLTDEQRKKLKRYR